MNLVFLDLIGWDYDVTTPLERPLGGSQSAVCYLAVALAQRGHQITLLSATTRPRDVLGVRCLSFKDAPIAAVGRPCEAVVVINGPADYCLHLRPHVSPGTLLVLWTGHDVIQPAMHSLGRPEARQGWDLIVCVSDWHRSSMIAHYGLEASRVVILRNAMAPAFQALFPNAEALVRAKDSKLILTYTSIPFRGLDVLLAVFPEVRRAFPQAELHVYSSMAVYEQDAADDPGRPLYDQCRAMSGVKYLGSVPQPVLAQALRSAAMFTFPSTIPETSCIIAMEALAAGLNVVTSDLGALPETTMGFGTLVPADKQGRDLQQFTERYLSALKADIQRWAADPAAFAAARFQQVQVVNEHCTWQRRAAEWEQVIEGCRQSGGPSQGGAKGGAAPTVPLAAIRQAMETALAHHQAGRLEQAEQSYRRILEAKPAEPNALHFLGLIAHQTGQDETAVAHMKQALRANPAHWSAHNNLGLTLLALGKLDEAADSLREAVRHNPNFAEAHGNLARVLVALGRFDEALACCRRALQLRPAYAEALAQLGATLAALGQLPEAAASCQQALRLSPHLLEAHQNLGEALKAQGRIEEAAAHERRALELRQGHAQAYHNQGMAHARQGHMLEAAASYVQALRLQPDDADAHSNLGNVWFELGRLDAAAACYRRALRHMPDLALAHNGLGNVLAQQGKFDEAVACYRQALACKPDLAVAHSNLGNALTGQGKLQEGAMCYRRALELNPSFAEAHCNLGSVLKNQGEVEEAIACYQRAVQLKPDLAAIYSNFLLILQYRPGITLAELAAAHAEFERCYAVPLRSTWKAHANHRDPQRRLRLGFSSPDLRHHPVGYFLPRVLENLDRRQVEVICYNDCPTPDHLTARLKHAATTWLDVYGLSDERLAEQVRADRIDILFDLAGHSAKNRLLVFARKPAPLQVTWAGYVGTTGLKAMDYILADDCQIPPQAETYYVERVLRMPDGYVCYDPPSYAPEVSALPALERGYVTFGSFNNPAKINRQVAALWARILQLLPEARLLLKYQGMDDSAVACRLAAWFAEGGVQSSRLQLLGFSPHPDLLARYHDIDVALDPFPYSGGLTTCEALWMGVPVLTCAGQTFASRHSLSHLANVGLKATIAATEDQYVELAVSLAGDLGRLAEMRAGMRQRVARSPLCDGKRFADNFLNLLRGAWREWARPG